MMGKRKIKKRILQVVVSCICISQLQFLGEVAAKENSLIRIADIYGDLFQKDIQDPEVPSSDVKEEEADVLLKEPDVQEEVAPVQSDQEIVEERTATSRTYRMADGSYLTEQFFEPIFKEENGSYVEIDDTLDSGGVRLFSGEQQFANEDGLLQVGMNESAVYIEDTTITYPQGDLTHPVAKDNAVLYNSFQEQQDMQITVRSDKVFQELKFTEKPQEALLSMKLETPYTVEEQGNALIFKDEDGNEKAVWKAPVLEDQQHRMSLQVDTVLEEQEDGYLVTYRGDTSFFNEETAYPVVMASAYDARLQIDVDSGYIRSGSPYETSNYYDLFVGYDTNGIASGLGTASIIGNGRTFIDFPMPNIGTNQLVTSASLILTKKTDYAGWEIPSIDVYDTNGSVNPDTVTWNTQPSNLTYVSSFSNLNGMGDKYFDITDIVAAMYKGKKTSIMLKSSAENNTSYIPSVFYSESSGSGTRPRIQIAHRDDYDVSPDIGINTFQAKFRVFSSGYSRFQAISMDGIAKPHGKVNVELHEKKDDQLTPVKDTLSGFTTGVYFVHPIYQDSPLSNVQKYPYEDANYTTGYYRRDFFPLTDTVYTFLLQPVKGSEYGKKVESDSFLFYKVKLGDNLKNIAAHYGTSVARIKEDNNTTSNIVKEGDEILIRYPADMPTLTKDAYTPPIRIETYEAKFKYRGPMCFGNCFEGDPINTSTGNFYHQTTDFTLQDYDDLHFQRTYNSIGENSSVFGDGFNTPFEQYVAYDADNNILYFAGDGKILQFPYKNGSYQKTEDHTLSVVNDKVRIENTLTGEIMDFDVYGMLTSITTKEGHKIVLRYDLKGRIQGVSVGGKEVDFEYYPDRMLVKAIHLPSGDKVQYEYDGRRLVRFIDAAGNQEEYHYDENGKIRSITDRSGYDIANNTYDEEGRVLTQEDGKGQKTTISYSGNAATITYPDQTTKTYRHDGDYKISTITDENGDTSSYTYQNGRMVSKKDKSGTITYEYDSAGNLTKQNNPDGTTLEYTYDDRQNLLMKKDSVGKTESYTYSAGNDVLSHTDNDGITTTYVYDAQHHVTKETDVFGAWKSYTYEGNQIKTITHSNGLVITLTYDANGNLLKESDNNGRTTSYQYDHNNRLIQKTDALGYSEKYQYDGNGNLIAYVDGNGGVTTYVYDANGNQIQTNRGNLTSSKQYDVKNRILTETDEQGQTTSYVYDGAGNKIASIDNYSQKTSYVYNVQGDVIETIDPKGNRMIEEYDEGHRRLSLTDPQGNQTKYAYDDAGQLIETIQANGKTTATTYADHRPQEQKDEFGNITSLEYDAYGRIIRKTDAQGNVTETTYDMYGQPNVVTENGMRTTYTYDVYGNVIQTVDPYGIVTKRSYDALDRISVETDALNQTIRHYYDGIGNEVQTVDQAGYTVKRDYNLLGQCIKETDENGHETLYTYDNRGQNTGVSKGNMHTTFLYDAHGNITETKVNGVTAEEKEYDAYGRVIRERTPEKTMAYEYDTFDNVILETNETTGLSVEKEYDSFSNVLREEDSEGRTTIYTYDDYHRLVETEDAYGRVQTSVYDDFQHIIEQTSFTGETTKNVYDEHQDLVSTIDANGNETIYVYDGQHRLLQSTYHDIVTSYTYDALGRTIAVHTSHDDKSTYTAYDAKGNVISETDKNGNTVTHAYDGKNQEVSTTDGRGNTSTKEYDAFGNIIKETDANGNIRQTKYNAFNMKEMEVDERGFSTTYIYDEQLRLKELVGKFDETTRYVYNEHNQVKEIIDGNGNATSYAYDPYGNTIKETDANGNVTETTYDALNNVIRTEEGDKITEHTYDDYGRLVRTKINDVTTLQQTYDDTGRIIEKTENGNTSKMTYDSYGNLLHEDINGHSADYVYDKNNRIIEKTDGESRIYTYTYDDNGNELSQRVNGTLGTSADYDENNNVIRRYEDGIHKQYVLDANNQKVEEQYRINGTYETYFRYAYDEGGNLVEIENALGETESRTYDANGQVTSQTDANGHVTKYAYDCMSNLLKVQNAKDTVMTYTYDGNYNQVAKTIGDLKAEYVYDEYDRKIEEHNEYGYEEAYAYDAFDQLVSYTKPDGTVIAYAYDAQGNKIKEGKRSFTYDEEGNLIKASDPDQTITYVYDDYRNIIETTDSKGRTTSYTYDVLGNQTSITYDDGTLVEYEYNALNKITKVIQDGEVTAQYTYDDMGHALTAERKGILTVTQYDALGRKTDILSTRDGIPLSHVSYTYDGANNITSETIDGKTNTYTYNELDELKESVKYNEDGQQVTVVYGYDFFGNQTETSGDRVKTYEYKDQKLVRIKDETGITNIQYNDNGNMEKISKSDGVKEQYTYDEYGQLVELKKGDGTTYTYIYDPQGDRVGYKKENNDPIHQNAWYEDLHKKTAEEGLAYVKEHQEESFAVFKEKLNQADDYLCTFDEEYFHTDWYQSSSEQIIDKTKEYHEVLWQSGEGNQIYGNERLYSEGADSETIYLYGLHNSVYGYLTKKDGKETIRKQRYDDFGYAKGIGSGYGYNGEFRDESELIYLRARYYHPKIGRFIQIDSFKGDTDSIESQNRYIYTQNNPYKYTDPSGHNVFDDFRKNAGILNAQQRKNHISLVKEAEEERKRYTRKNILHVEEKKQPAPRMTCQYDLYGNKVCKPAPPQPCPTLSDQIVGLIKPVTNTVDVAVRNFFSWVDENLNTIARVAGFIALGTGFIALTAATMGLFPACAGWTIAGISVSTIATSTAPVAIVSGTIGMGGSITQIASGTMGYRLDGTKLTEEQAKERILNGQFNASISSTGVSFGTLAGTIMYVNGELSSNTANKESGNPVKLEGRGSTGRTIPNNILEQTAMNNAKIDPLSQSIRIMEKMSDPRWSGWDKYQIVYYTSDNKITIHFVYDPINHLFDDFKFVFPK